MAKKTAARKLSRKAARKSVRSARPRARERAVAAKRTRPAGRRASKTQSPLLQPVTGAESREVGRVRLDVGRAGAARVKRMVYPPGFRWSVDMKPMVGTELCMHAHVGFLAHGEIHVEYPDGCIVEHRAPQIVAIEPGHDGWVVGREPVVLIEFDFENETIRRTGMPDRHRHQ